MSFDRCVDGKYRERDIIMKRTYGALILAGGKGRRMGGKNKALLELNEQTFFEHLQNILEDFEEKIVSANETDWITADGYTVLTDENRGCGPIEGLRRALTYCKSDALFVTACDTPFLTKDFVNALVQAAKGHEVLICRDSKGGIHPLCGVYSKKCLPVIEKMIRNGDYRVRKIAEQTEHAIFNMERTAFDSSILTNINTLNDFEDCLSTKYRKI